MHLHVIDGMPGLFWVLVFAIPIVSIIGGIVTGVVRTLGKQRLIELAQRERIAAIERGIEPSKLPPLPVFTDNDEAGYGPDFLRRTQRNRHQGLLIGGIVTLAVGTSLAIMIRVLQPGDTSDSIAARGQAL